MKIALDIGHSTRTGTIINGADEHEESAHNAAVLKNILEHYGCTVDIIDFPHTSNTADLSATIKAVNSGNYAAVISLHCDSGSNPAARGAHVCFNRTYRQDGSYTNSTRGQGLAKEIASRLCPQMPGRANKIQPRPDRALNLSSLAILRKTTPPAVLVEVGFLSSPEDLERIRSLRHELMTSIAQGLIAWLGITI